MKKIILVALLSVFSISCQSKTEDLTNKAEDFLVQNLKDPSSYERISIVKTDTLTDYDMKKYIVDMYESGALEPVAPIEVSADFTKEVEKYKKEKKEAKEALDKATKTPKFIEVVFKYRAKNSLGALDISTTKVKLDVVKNSWSIEE